MCTVHVLKSLSVIVHESLEKNGQPPGGGAALR
jgi:hypothetical protein